MEPRATYRRRGSQKHSEILKALKCINGPLNSTVGIEWCPAVLEVNDFFLSLPSGLPLDSGCWFGKGSCECSFLVIPLVAPVELTRTSGQDVDCESAGCCVQPDLATYYPWPWSKSPILSGPWFFVFVFFNFLSSKMGIKNSFPCYFLRWLRMYNKVFAISSVWEPINFVSVRTLILKASRAKGVGWWGKGRLLKNRIESKGIAIE